MVLFKKGPFLWSLTPKIRPLLFIHTPLKVNFSCQIVVQQRAIEMITFLLHEQCPFRNIVKSVTRLIISAWQRNT